MNCRHQGGSTPYFFETAVVLLSLLAAGLVFIATSRYGIGLNTDSIGYVTTAQFLRAGKGFYTYDEGIPYVKYPPLYPVGIAFFKLFFQDVYEGIRLFHVITASLIVYVSGMFFRQFFPNVIAILGAFLVTISPPLLFTHTMAWSEPFFILLLMLFFLQLPSYLEHSTIKGTVFLAFLTALATLQRYIGIALLPVGALMIIVAHNTQGIRKKMQLLMIYTITALAPLGLWLFRNYLLTSTLTGDRFPSRYSLEDNINSLLFTFFRWFFPVRELPKVTILVAIAILSCIIFLIAINIFRVSSIRSKSIYLISFFVISYCLFVIYMSPYYQQTVDQRYLTPIFIPVIFVISAGLYQCAECAKRFFPSYRTDLAFLLIFCLWLYYPTSLTFRNVTKQFHGGAGGYRTEKWQNSTMIHWLQQYPWDGIIYSNWKDVFYLFSQQKAHLVPHKDRDLLRFRQSLRTGERYYLVWFSRMVRHSIYSLDELKQVLTLREVRRFQEGEVYEILEDAT
jgi:4-amino-4-deoxy-L-arabinose transferase-like glycosyltransferase